MPKSPFVSAQRETETFIYPSPLDEPDARGNATRESLIDPEVMNDESGKELPPEQRPWVKVRIPRSASDVDKVADLTQPAILMSDNGDGSGSALDQRIARMNRGLFELLVDGWSFTTGKPEGQLYDRLDQWAAAWVRNCLGEANRRGTSVDFHEPTPSSSEPVETLPAKSRRGSQAE